jgi:hypothetical protein
MGHPGSRPLAVVTGRQASLFDRLTTLDRNAARRQSGPPPNSAADG